jgi:hypothetical protein
MKTIDLSKHVKLKNPQPGEENLIFNVSNFNEVTNRCYIDAINLPGFAGSITPSELVSVDDIENIEEN